MFKNILQSLENDHIELSAAFIAFDSELVQTEIQKLKDTIQILSASWSGSWLGYHSTVYIEKFKSKSIADFFDPECGLMKLYGSRTDRKSVV